MVKVKAKANVRYKGVSYASGDTFEMSEQEYEEHAGGVVVAAEPLIKPSQISDTLSANNQSEESSVNPKRKETKPRKNKR